MFLFKPLFPDIWSISMVTQNWNGVFCFFLCVKGRVYFWKRRRPKSPTTFFLLHANKLFPFRKGFFPPKRTVYNLPRFFQWRDDLDFSQKMASTKLYYRHRQFSQNNYVQPVFFFFNRCFTGGVEIQKAICSVFCIPVTVNVNALFFTCNKRYLQEL